MDLERNQNLHNEVISSIGNVSASLDPKQIPNDGIELLLKGAAAAGAGRTLGLTDDETVELLARTSDRRMSQETEQMQRRLEKRAGKRGSQRRRRDLQDLSAEEIALLQAEGINPRTYGIGPKNDNNQFSGEKGRLAQLFDDGQNELQNFGGVDEKGRVKDANKAIEEQQRARKSGVRAADLNYQLPNQRPGVDEYVDDLVRNGMSDQQANRHAFALKKQGVTDPVGENMKVQDFGIYGLANENLIYDANGNVVRDPGGYPGRYPVRNEAGYPGQFVWNPTGDLQINQPKPAEFRGPVFYNESEGEYVPKHYPPMMGVGDFDADGNQVITPFPFGPRAGLDGRYLGAGDEVVIEGGKGRYDSVRKDGVKRFRYKAVGDNPGPVGNGNPAIADAARRLREGLDNGTIPADKQAEALRLLGDLELQLDPRAQIEAEKSLVRDMVIRDNADGAINQQVRDRNLDRAVANAEVGLRGDVQLDGVEYIPNGLKPVMAEAAERKMFEALATRPPVSASSLPEAINRNGIYVDEYNEVIAPESAALDRLERQMLGMAEGETTNDLRARVGPARFWMEESLIDDYDRNAGGGYNEAFEPFEINRTLQDLNKRLQQKGVRTPVRSLDELESVAMQLVNDQVRKGGAFFIKDPDTKKQVAVSNPGIGEVLDSLGFSSGGKKNIARVLFTLDQAQKQPVNTDVKAEFFAKGKGVQNSPAELIFDVRDEPRLGRLGRERINGQEIAPALRQLSTENGVQKQVEAAVAQLRPLQGASPEALMERESEIREISKAVRERAAIQDEFNRDVNVQDAMRDARMNLIGVVDGERKGGNNDLEGRVFQGMTDGQIQHYFDKRGQGDRANAAIANAQGLRERQARHAEDLNNRRFVEAHASPRPQGLDGVIRDESQFRTFGSQASGLNSGARGRQGKDSIAPELVGERQSAAPQAVKFQIPEGMNREDIPAGFAQGLKARAGGVGERMSPRERLYGKGVASEDEFRMRGEGPTFASPREKRAQLDAKYPDPWMQSNDNTSLPTSQVGGNKPAPAARQLALEPGIQTSGPTQGPDLGRESRSDVVRRLKAENSRRRSFGLGAAGLAGAGGLAALINGERQRREDEEEQVPAGFTR